MEGVDPTEVDLSVGGQCIQKIALRMSCRENGTYAGLCRQHGLYPVAVQFVRGLTHLTAVGEDQHIQFINLELFNR